MVRKKCINWNSVLPVESQSPKLSSPEPPEEPEELDFRLAFLLRPRSPNFMVGVTATPKLLKGLWLLIRTENMLSITHCLAWFCERYTVKTHWIRLHTPCSEKQLNCSQQQMIFDPVKPAACAARSAEQRRKKNSAARELRTAETRSTMSETAHGTNCR